MQLEKIEARIRPRTPWEAVDLGVLMASRWWKPLFRAWLVITLPVFVLMLLVLPHKSWLPLLLFWWLKPLWERIPLYILSQELFGHTPDMKESIGHFFKDIRKHFFSSLLWRRTNLQRSMDTPVIILEGLSGPRYKNRLNLLHREDDQPAQWLTLIGVHLEGFIFLSAYFLAYMLAPQQYQGEFGETLLAVSRPSTVYVSNMIYYFAITLVAPYYSACGFALYLNRRVKLEAWDIEVIFRRIVQKQHAVSRAGLTNIAASVLLIIAAGLSLTPQGRAWAAENPVQEEAVVSQTLMSPETAKSAIESIMETDRFNEKSIQSFPDVDEEAIRNSWFGKLIRGLFEDDDDPAFSLDWLAQIAGAMELLLWMAVISLILIIVYRYRYWIAQLGRAGPRTQRPEESEPQVPDFLDTAAGSETLPDDVLATAGELWSQEKSRQAIALLYRASLARFLQRHDLDLPSSATEGDCLKLVRKTVESEFADYFTELNQVWLYVAYGKTPPSKDKFRNLCERWASTGNG